MSKKERTIKQNIASEENWDIAQIICAIATVCRLVQHIKKRIPITNQRDFMLADAELIVRKLSNISAEIKQFQKQRIDEELNNG